MDAGEARKVEEEQQLPRAPLRREVEDAGVWVGRKWLD